MISDTQIEKIRREFPLLNSDRVYFDHAAASPMSSRVKKYLAEFIHEAHEGIINNYRESQERREAVRDQVSKLISAPRDRIAFVKSTTDGLILLARGFNWHQGDRVLLFRNEFPSNIYPWWELKEYGVEVDLIDTEFGNITPEVLEKEVKPGTRIVSVSWVQYLSGCRSDIKALAKWCHNKGIFIAVDGMQGLGALKLNINDTGIDFLATGTSKWLMGPHGTGFIYITEELQSRIHPPHSGWLSRENVIDFHNYDQTLKDSASRYEFATENNLGIAGLYGALDMLLEVSPDTIESRIKLLSDHVAGVLKDHGFDIFSPRDDSRWSGIITATTGNKEMNKSINKNLFQNGVIVSYRGNMLRVAPHFYNTLEDVEHFSVKLAAAIT